MRSLQSLASMVVLAPDPNGFKEIGDMIPNPIVKNSASVAFSRSWPNGTPNTAVGSESFAGWSNEPSVGYINTAASVFAMSVVPRSTKLS
jgi:hypothetical protein